jgi:hypothetical protein
MLQLEAHILMVPNRLHVLQLEQVCNHWREKKMTYCKYYCFRCDTPADEHREGSCRNCGDAVTSLVEKKMQGEQIAISIPKHKRMSPSISPNI